MMELLDIKHNWLLKVFHKTLILICEKTYSMVLDATTLQYLIILVAQQGLHLHLMDDVTAYLCDSLENDIYMKIPEGFNLPNKANFKEDYSIKLNKFLYGLKQSGRM